MVVALTLGFMAWCTAPVTSTVQTRTAPAAAPVSSIIASTPGGAAPQRTAPAAPTVRSFVLPVSAPAQPSARTKLYALPTLDGEGVRSAYLAGVRSPDLLDKYIALQVDSLCRGFLSPANQAVMNTRVLLERGVGAAGIANAEAAIRTLRSRCEPFLRIPRSELDSNEKSFRDALEQPGSPFKDMRRLLPDATDAVLGDRRQQLLRAFAVDERGAMQWANAALIEYLEIQRTRGNRNVIEVSDVDAGILARCELGFPCGPESVALLLVCAQSGICHASMFDAVMANWPNEMDRNRLLRQRDALVAALKARDFKKLGLD